MYLVNFATFEESWILGHRKRPLWTPATGVQKGRFRRPKIQLAPKRDMMWYEISRSSFFSSLRIFYIEMAISEECWGGRGGVDISLIMTGSLLNIHHQQESQNIIIFGREYQTTSTLWHQMHSFIYM